MFLSLLYIVKFGLISFENLTETRGGGGGGGGRQARGRRGGGGRQRPPVPTVEELDAELDAYVKEIK